MDRTGVDLPALYASGEYTDCIFKTSDGFELAAHRLVVGQYARFKDLIAQAEQPRCVVPLDASKVVVERILQWMYRVEWTQNIGQAPTTSVGAELLQMMQLCDAAGKVSVCLHQL